MTVAQFEERLTALEKAVAQLQAQLPRGNGTAPAAGEESAIPGEDEVMPGTEYVMVLQGSALLQGDILRNCPVLGSSQGGWREVNKHGPFRGSLLINLINGGGG